MPMSKVLAGIILSVALVALSFFFEKTYPLGDVRWLYISMVLFVLWAILMSPNWFPYLKNKWFRSASRKQGEGWIPIADAVDQIVEEYESYRIIGDKHNSRLHAFQDIHELMCKGKVKVRGALHKSSEKSKQLSRKLCRKLKPIIAGSAIGSVYNLIDPEPDPPATKTEGPHGKGEVRWQGQGIYDDLRIRSRDLRKSWPDAVEKIEQSRYTDGQTPAKKQIQQWMEFVKKYELDWKGSRLNIVYEPTWVHMRPFLQEDTVAASNQRLTFNDLLASAVTRKGPKHAIHSGHLKTLLRRDLLALMQDSQMRRG